MSWYFFLLEHYYLVSVLVLAVVFIIFAIRYLNMAQQNEIILIAVYSAVTAIARGAFTALPQINPSIAMSVMFSVYYGPIPGCLVGMTSMFISNFLIGQGPWTPFQMLAVGLICLLSGILRTKNRIIGVVYNFIGVFVIYGLIMNFATMIMCGEATWEGYKMYIISGIPYDLLHAGSSSIFYYFTFNMLSEKFERMYSRYLIFNREPKRR